MFFLGDLSVHRVWCTFNTYKGHFTVMYPEVWAYIWYAYLTCQTHTRRWNRSQTHEPDAKYVWNMISAHLELFKLETCQTFKLIAFICGVFLLCANMRACMPIFVQMFPHVHVEQKPYSWICKLSLVVTDYWHIHQRFLNTPILPAKSLCTAPTGSCWRMQYVFTNYET